MTRIEIGIKMERLSEILVRTPNRLEDIRDLCLELATDIDQYLQEVEDENYDHHFREDEDYDEEEYNIEEDERFQEYHYRYGHDDE
ncbi:hypothetical protein GF339_14030 [candidate division KSB3 bacterium]|uniref:Uncharacterized protein n=1 Tax=candidate division KSB3 bacterium TaxID=2044937 RepID=A0A9D5JX37_9BACT|nr:hypothetical protein [candidate division KSB3 bacterium]MBD3325700.1 hypothetical protein [candidate division KSB3 bacterium]